MKISFNQAVERAYEHTQKWWKEQQPETPAPLSTKAKKIQDAVYDNRIDKDLLTVFSILIDEKIPRRTTGSGLVAFIPGLFVVPLANDNSHDYTINEPVQTTDDGRDNTVSMSLQGNKKNHVTKTRKFLRPATSLEIAAWFRNQRTSFMPVEPVEIEAEI